jgi:hypothetical protein
MKNADRKKFAEIILGFAELKGKQLSAPAIELYWNAMQPWSIEEFQGAANVLIRRCEFMPTPKDFEDLRRAELPTAGEAWARVLAAVRSSSYAEGVDPQIDRAVAACGGYRAIGQLTDDGLPFMERRFSEHYESMSDATEVREALGYERPSDPELRKALNGVLKRIGSG